MPNLVWYLKVNSWAKTQKWNNIDTYLLQLQPLQKLPSAKNKTQLRHQISTTPRQHLEKLRSRILLAMDLSSFLLKVNHSSSKSFNNKIAIKAIIILQISQIISQLKRSISWLATVKFQNIKVLELFNRYQKKKDLNTKEYWIKWEEVLILKTFHLVKI